MRGVKLLLPRLTLARNSGNFGKQPLNLMLFNHFESPSISNFTTDVDGSCLSVHSCCVVFVGGYDHLLLGFPPAAPQPFGGKGGEDQQHTSLCCPAFSYPQSGNLQVHSFESLLRFVTRN